MSNIGQIIQSTINAVLSNLDPVNVQQQSTLPLLTNNVKKWLLPTTSTETDCSICLDTFSQLAIDSFVLFPNDESCSSPGIPLIEDHSPVKLPCGHIFGSSCVKEWLLKSPQCPLCRTKFNQLEEDNKIIFNHKIDEIYVPCNWVSKNQGQFIMPVSKIGVSYGKKRTI